MQDTEEQVMLDALKLCRKSYTCSDPVRKAELEYARNKAIKRFKETSHYKGVYPKMLDLLAEAYPSRFFLLRI